MAKRRTPELYLGQKAPQHTNAIYTFLLLAWIPGFLFCLGYLVFGISLIVWPMKNSTFLKSVILFIAMMIPFVTEIERGYKMNTVEVPNGEDNEEWLVGVESAIKTYAHKVLCPSDNNIHPALVEKVVRKEKRRLAQYVADPYYIDKSSMLPWFSRRRLYHDILAWSAYGLLGAAMTFDTPFTKLSMNDIKSQYFESFLQGAAGGFLVFYCYTCWPLMWRFGWALKMGSVARHIRNECLCLENVNLEGSEQDVEKCRLNGDSEEMLRWWVEEMWKGCEDTAGDLQSENPRAEVIRGNSAAGN